VLQLGCTFDLDNLVLYDFKLRLKTICALGGLNNSKKQFALVFQGPRF
jgi:hypothetical protein